MGSKYDFVISFNQAIKEDKWWKYWREPEEEGERKQAFEYAWLDWGHGERKNGLNHISECNKYWRGGLDLTLIFFYQFSE